MSFDSDHALPPGAKIKVIGIGGGGGNAVNTMIRENLEGVDFISCNTDVQALRFSMAPTQIQIGKELTKGLGAGADPDIGRDAALEDRHGIQEALGDSDMVFITAGMGGGTGTGGASVIAQIAREMGALTVAVVTKPFHFEGKRRRKLSEQGIQQLRGSVDTLITIPNQRLLQVASPDLSMVDAFKMADNVLLNAVKGISDIINVPGTVNVDFADVKTIMSSMGLALMGVGAARGDERAVDAARQAISSPLLEDVDIEGATGILINITAGSNITLMEVNEACSIVQEAAHEDANIIFGAVIDENVGEEIRVTVIATGFPSEHDHLVEPPQASRAAFQRPRSFRPAFGQSFALPESEGQPKAGAVTTPVAETAPEPTITAEPEATAAPAVDEPPVPATEELPQLNTLSEAESLAKLTMAGVSEPEPEAHESENLLPKELMEQAEIQGATLAPESNIEETAEITIDAQDEILATEQPTPTGEAPPMETMFSRAAAEKDPFDAKIDEALELAERLRSAEEESKEAGDDLDIPAFLRPGGGNLSLD